MVFWWCLNWSDISCRGLDGRTGNITFQDRAQCNGFGSFAVRWYSMKPMALALAYSCAEMVERFSQVPRPVNLKK